MAVAGFKVHKNELLAVLKRLMQLEKAGKKADSTLEVTIINTQLRLNIPGAEVPVAATTTGSAKFTMRLWYFFDIVKSEKDSVLEFGLTDGQLKLRGFSWNIPTTFFENDRILRSINLPINYKYLDIVRLFLSDKYTLEEIEFNKLDKDVIVAIDKLKADIDKVTTVLKKYGFKRDEVEHILSEKLIT